MQQLKMNIFIHFKHVKEHICNTLMDQYSMTVLFSHFSVLEQILPK